MVTTKLKTISNLVLVVTTSKTFGKMLQLNWFYSVRDHLYFFKKEKGPLKACWFLTPVTEWAAVILEFKYLSLKTSAGRNSIGNIEETWWLVEN